jgi:hypothetical protein
MGFHWIVVPHRHASSTRNGQYYDLALTIMVNIVITHELTQRQSTRFILPESQRGLLSVASPILVKPVDFCTLSSYVECILYLIRRNLER